MLREIVAERARPDGAAPEVAARLVLEPHDLRQHVQEARRQEIAPLREQRAEHAGAIAAAPFEPAVVGRNRKAHVGGLGRNIEPGEHGGEIRVVQFIVDDEAGVHRKRRSIVIDVDGGSMAAGALILFKQHDVMARAVEREARADAGNAGSNNSDTHVDPFAEGRKFSGRRCAPCRCSHRPAARRSSLPSCAQWRSRRSCRHTSCATSGRAAGP